MAKLIIRDGKGGEVVHEIKDDVTTFGRSSANIIQIKDEQASRQHFRIEKAGDSHRLVDLGSRNGTIVNGVKVSGQTLKPGDTITLGEYKITFDEPIQVSGDELGATVECKPLAEKDLTAPAAAAAPAAPVPVADKPAAPAEPSAPRFVLEVVEGASKGKVAELGLDPVTIGRNASNKLCIDDEASSNYHAEVTKEAIGYVISDLGSTNGTKVNGEKVVKSPLAHNSRIRIGSTEIAFKNLGAPTEEDAVFGTVVLDSDKLGKELAAAKSSSGAGAGFLKLVAALVLVGGAGYGAYVGIAHLRQNGKPVPVPAITDIVNRSFADGTDASGNPRGWLIAPGDERNIILVDKGKDRDEQPAQPGAPAPEKYSLKFQRDPATARNAFMECRQAGDFEVDKAKGYRASVFVNSPGAQGLYGLRLTWTESADGGRRWEDFQRISGAHPDWDKVEVSTRPPLWAGRLSLALVAYGNVGNVWFDDVALQKIDPKEAVRTEESVEYHGVRASFDACGRLDLERGGVRALSGLILAEGQGKVATDQSLAQPAQGYPRHQGDDPVFRGNIFDFFSRQSFVYDLTASKAADGVRLQYSFSTPAKEMTLDSLALRLEVEPAFAGKAEVFAGEERKALVAGDNAGVTELVLGGARGETVLSLAFSPPATVNLSEGEKKRLTVFLAKSPSLSPAKPVDFTLTFGATSIGAAKKLEAEYAAVNKLFADKNWKEFPEQAKGFRAKHLDAAELLKKLDDLERQYQAKLADGQKQIDTLVKRAQSVKADEVLLTEACRQGTITLDALQGEWPTGTALDEALQAARMELARLQKIIIDTGKDKEAKVLLDKAIKAMEAKLWTIAKSYLATVISKYPDSKYVPEAKKLMTACDEAIKQEQIIDDEEQNILKAIRNDELNSRWDDVIRKIETDRSYIKYGKEMKRATQHLDDAKAKKADK
jgi:pSer/pThr/pTyr-binding forkhead associated (FHA) protein/TolA-binding protein